MSSRFKKVSLALYLDPTQSKADSYTFNTLSSWAKRRQELSLDASATMELHQLVHVHKDIYLSGLFLYQLKPELAKSMAAALAGESITETALFDALSLNQIDSEARSTSVENKYSELSIPDYSNKLDVLLSQQESTNEKISALRDQLNEPVFASEKDGKSMVDLPDYSGSFEVLLKQQAESHKQITDTNKQIISLQKLVQEQNRLIYQLMQQGVSGAGIQASHLKTESDMKSPMLPDEPKEQVEQRLAKVQKMKQKGVF
ncbi:hypothetical protein [Vibrio algivorus]|uniref:Uncharacterized protein n=1 Tax=Vibrio algivorus TaxID=1667024 RepID=A0A557P2L8_9VIBR|nr:hypothetical protein [Vibrio algivorus]TVO34915.1 hypothetical protein FOF44_12540 [Vibrio algivorus]